MSDAQETPQDPREMLALMERTRRATARRLNGRYVGLLVLWAVAWAIGFTALWLTDGVGGVALLPTAVGWIVFAAAMIIAMVWSAVVGIGASRDGIRGRSQLQGALYGCSWSITMFAAWLLIAGLQRNGLDNEMSLLVYPGVYVFLVGVQYLAGGALWREVPMYVLGAALIVVAVIATFVGAPVHFLVYATAAPIAMLTVAVLLYAGLLGSGEPRPTRSGAATDPRESL
ncbi:hypothetical protein N3K63_14345 [Microbacterium sp. W1N]|uniref:hypothetical protein n=1 Tax=Microbacterium festucae TaxID=2977531 RepID=UPI0021BFFE89|nr:hypothetical protein [Microbacterium festucae]MCT9821462.1 hypothetical protein [Microbacterium festucae]